MPTLPEHTQMGCNGPTITAHIVLVLSSLWSYSSLGLKIGYGTVALVLYVVTGILGIVLHSFSSCGHSLTCYKVYSNLWLWSLTFGLPSISSQMYAASNFSILSIVLHFLPPCLFVVFNMFYKRTQFILLEIMQALYLLVIFYISFLNTNYYGFALLTSYAISYYVIGLTGTIQNTPAKDLLSFSLAFSNYFTVKTLQGS